jgi:hypothetical protein
MAITDRDRGVGAAVTPVLSERRIFGWRRRWRGEPMAASLALIERAIPAIQLNTVMLLELIVEVLEELVEGSGGLVG